MCCSKPTIVVTTIKECHNNDKIEPHNHEYVPVTIIKTSVKFGQILECQRCNILVITQKLHSPLGIMHIIKYGST